jgi:CBS domain-containing protein
MEMHNKSLIYSGGDKLLFSTSVGELATKKIITASSDVSIREAAIIMSSSKITSLVLVDQNSTPIGIVTDRDLRDKVVSKGRNVEDPVHAVMSVSLIKADAREYCFEALLKMIRYNIHHLLVVEGGRLKGIITNHDLMMLQGTSPVSLVKEIENSQSIDDLAPVSKKNNSIVGLLLKEGARASNITRIITEINDRLCRKILEITERKLGPSPVRYCWIVFGSEGRKEQTFKTDQDNAIIFEDVASQEEMDQARSYLSKLADAVRDALLKCGFPPCPANFMASNPQWCQPLRVWRKYFSGWLNEPTPDALLKSLVFFDFRPLYGDFHLAEQLRESLSAGIEDNTLFLGSMANTIIRNVPPIGFFKTFIVEKSGEHKNELNLKVKGIAPLIDIVRLFSLEKGVKETSTIERLRALREKHTIVEEYAEEIEHAFEFIMLLRVHSQYEQVEIGESPDNFINPDSLSNLEKRSIKEAFQLISGLQDIIIDRYKVMIL